jgi:hypothetical protein
LVELNITYLEYSFLALSNPLMVVFCSDTGFRAMNGDDANVMMAGCLRGML